MLVKRTTWQKAMAAGGLAGLLLCVAVHVAGLMLRHNLHVLVPGRVYRSAQLAPRHLEKVIRTHGIRTVVNLRGCCDPMAWYLDECRATHRAGVSQEDVSFSAGRLPPVEEVRYLLRVLDKSEYPMLFHCRQGADRTGLAAVLYVLLFTDTPLSEARRQLGFRYGHIAVGRTVFIDRFFDLYEEWLQARAHSPTRLREWIEHGYCPDECRCTLTALAVPKQVPLGKPWLARFRASNTSLRPWRFHPSSTAGIHLGYFVTDRCQRYAALGRAATFEAVVPPGESIDIDVAIPALKTLGPHVLTVDMMDEQQGWFYQFGSQPLECELEVVTPLAAKPGISTK